MKNEYIFIKKKDHYCNTIQQFKNVFSSNNRILFAKGKITVDGKSLSCLISEKIITQSGEILYHLTVEKKDGKEEEQVEVINCVDDALRSTNEEYGIFHINTIWDETSMYYGRKLYPEIVEIENTLRKIIYLFMLKNIGSKWLETNAPIKARDTIEETIEKNNLTGKVETDWLTYADFITLGIFFSAKYSLKSDVLVLVEELRKTENQTKEKIENLTEDYISKSNWERYFADKVNCKGIWKKWNSLYNYRNQVAHSKSISKADYEKAVTLIEELRQVFEEWLKHMDEVNMTEEQSDAVEGVAQKTIAAKDTIVIRDEDCVPIATISNVDWGKTLSLQESLLGTQGLELTGKIGKNLLGSDLPQMLTGSSALKIDGAISALEKLQSSSKILGTVKESFLGKQTSPSLLGTDLSDSLHIDSSGIKLGTLIGSEKLGIKGIGTSEILPNGKQDK